jgi:hypothetical protein
MLNPEELLEDALAIQRASLDKRGKPTVFLSRSDVLGLGNKPMRVPLR